MSAQRKNILLISFDDAVSFWHYKTLFGAELKTPNLDRICAQATAFHSAYCQSPLCGPSRASFMSGKTPPQTGIYGNKDKFYNHIDPTTMWPFRLKEGGYFCSSGGKVHHGFKPLPPKVHQMFYSDARKGFRIDLNLRPEFTQKRTGGNGGGISTTDPKDDGYYHDAQSAGSFEKFISEYDADQPFYREVGFFSPHSPFITPDRYKSMYPLESFHYPTAWADGFHRSDFSNTQIRRTMRTQKTRYWRKSVRNYFSAVSHGDHHLGRVWDALQKSPHADTTVVIIVSDHGFHLGEDGRFGKSTLFEQSALVPMIIFDPDDRTAREIKSPVGLIDLGATVLDYVGMDADRDGVGTSLRPLVQGAAPDPDRAIPTFSLAGSSTRKGHYRYILYRDGTTELYDLNTDWWQQNPLAPDHEDYGAMQTAHVACCAQYGLNL